jgi:hypothetical protein
MARTRMEAVWDALRPEASRDGVVPVGPQVDAIDLKLRAKIQDVLDNLDVAKQRILALEAAMAGKAPLQHTHTAAQVTGLVATIQDLQARVTALENP